MSELNNRLRNQEEEKKSKVASTVLGATGVALGAVAAGTEAQAKEVLLCTIKDEKTGVASTLINDPESSQDQIIPGNPDNPMDVIDSGAPQIVWKGFILQPVCDYVEGGICDWNVFKNVNGQNVKVGTLEGDIGSQPIGFVTNSGVALSSGKFYEITDDGTTLVSKEIGKVPVAGSITHFGGYVFVNHTDANNQHREFLTAISEEDILNSTDGTIPIKSGNDVEIPVDLTLEKSFGVDIDLSTGELVMAIKEGYVTASLAPFLNQDGKLSPDFSLTKLTFSSLKNLGCQTGKIVASNGYKYFSDNVGENLIIQTPQQAVTGDFTTINKSQLGGGVNEIQNLLKLTNGGVYVTFKVDLFSPEDNQAPVVVHESGATTVDPAENMTKQISTCSVVPQEDQYLFDPVPDPCAETSCNDANACTTDACTNENGQAVCDNTPNVGQTCDDQAACTVNDKCDLNGDCAGTPKTCPAPANQCEQSAGCDSNTGSCLVENKTDGTLCNDGNIGTENDQCVSGACQGTPIVNPEPEPDVVELNPEADVVEQGPDTVEQDNEVVEQEEITGDTGDAKPGDTSDATDTEEDLAEDLTGDNSDTGDAAEEDATEDTADNDNANPELDTHDALYVEGEDATEIAAEINADTQEVIAAEKDHPKKAPGCGCTTTGVSPDSMSGVLLMGAMLIGLAANMRYKILNALMRRR